MLNIMYIIFITSKILTIMIFTINRIKETYHNP